MKRRGATNVRKYPKANVTNGSISNVMKCIECNGSGMIFPGGSKKQKSNVDNSFDCNTCSGNIQTVTQI